MFNVAFGKIIHKENQARAAARASERGESGLGFAKQSIAWRGADQSRGSLHQPRVIAKTPEQDL